MKEEKQKISIELRSEEVQEIISQAPRWIIRSGITMMFVIILLLFLGSWVFKYPDIITGQVVVVSENPPVYLAARTTGKIDQLLVEDQQMVDSNQVIAVMESAANYKDAFRLKEKLERLETFMVTFDTLQSIPLDFDYELGDIQASYSNFIRLYSYYFSFLRLDLYPKKIKSLKEQVKMTSIYYDRMWTQRQILEKDYLLTKGQYERDSALHAKGVLSELDLEKSGEALLQKKFNFNEIRTALAETQSDIISLKQSLVDTEVDYVDYKRKTEYTLIEAFNVLKSRLAYWEKTYVIRTPITGKISFADFWSKNQEVKNDANVFSVVPEENSEIIARTALPIKGAGKVKIGQFVNIRFDNFPYMEYGMLHGRIRSISLLPSNDRFIVEVEIPQNLKTNYNIELTFTQEMRGTAEIVTEDQRLLRRILNPLKSMIKHRVTTESNM